ncbi:MAG: response regulator, partial [Anaerotignum sp.]
MSIKARILVVEDEEAISNFIETTLKSNDFGVLSAKRGQEALSMIASHCPDLILLDLGLPDLDGISILKQLRTWSS